MVTTIDLAGLDTQSDAEQGITKIHLSSLSLAVAKSKRMVVVTGAGISCSSGIPDFRSSDGLYALVKSQHPGAILKGKDLFNAAVFRDPATTQIFFTFMAELKAAIDVAKPSPTHHFLKTLDAKGKLLRSYTQNIDGLEERAGLQGTSTAAPPPKTKGKKLIGKEVKNIQLHGDIRRVQCNICSSSLDYTEEHAAAFKLGSPPECPECKSRCDARAFRAARPVTVGTLRPAIVLYDEPHPLGDEIGDVSSRDILKKPDLLVIMGTSLQVHGVKQLVKGLASAVHATTPPSPSKRATSHAFLRKVIFVNRTPPSAEWASVIDYWVKSETDLWVEKCEEDWRSMRPQDWETQCTLDEVMTTDNDVFAPSKLQVVKPSALLGHKGNKKHHSTHGAENTPPSASLPGPSRRLSHGKSKPSSKPNLQVSPSAHAPTKPHLKLTVEIPVSKKRPADQELSHPPNAKSQKTKSSSKGRPPRKQTPKKGTAAKTKGRKARPKPTALQIPSNPPIAAA